MFSTSQNPLKPHERCHHCWRGFPGTGKRDRSILVFSFCSPQSPTSHFVGSVQQSHLARQPKTTCRVRSLMMPAFLGQGKELIWALTGKQQPSFSSLERPSSSQCQRIYIFFDLCLQSLPTVLPGWLILQVSLNIVSLKWSPPDYQYRVGLPLLFFFKKISLY